MTKSKKIEKIKYQSDEDVFIAIDTSHIPELYVNVTLLAEKINEIIDELNKREEGK